MGRRYVAHDGGLGACVSIQFGALEYAKRFFSSRKTGAERAELNLGRWFLGSGDLVEGTDFPSWMGRC